MSAITSSAVLTALTGLAKTTRPLASRLRDMAMTRPATMSATTIRALSLSDATAQLSELPSPARAVGAIARHEEQIMAELRQRDEHLGKLELEKTAVIAGVLRAPLVTEHVDHLQDALARVDASKTQRELVAARTRLHDLVAAEHGDAWLASLQEITKTAYEKIGFRMLQSETCSRREIRMSAINSDGKVLVSELRLQGNGSPSMATEVVNGCGAECEGILAQFESALEEHVRGAAPVRKPTGGVCQLDAAVAFVKRRVQRTTPRTTPASTRRRARPKHVVIQKRS